MRVRTLFAVLGRMRSEAGSVGKEGLASGATRAEMIARAIRKAVIEHRVPPGTRLSEDQIGMIFGASRTIVRAALHSLAHDHIVSLAKNRGASVASPTVEDARHLFDARRTLETAIVARASERWSDADTAALLDLVEQGERASGSADRGVAIRLSGEFHLRLADVADQPILRGFLVELVSRSSLVIALYGQGRDADCGADDHALLIDALAAGRKQRAVDLMVAHLHHIENSLELTNTLPSSRPLVDAFFTHALSA